jgi:hypothetical protein
MEITLAEAAQRLGVSARQAQRLASAGRLQIVRRVGASYLVDDTGLTRADAASRGRVWSARTAWAAVDLLQHGTSDRLTGSALSRLRSRLRHIEAEDLVRLSADRASVWRGMQTRRSRDALVQEIALSGESLLADRDVASALGLVALTTGRIEGYVRQESWDAVVGRYGLEADAEGDVLLHATTEHPTAGVVSCAIDLAERWSARERGAALRFLSERLHR